MTKKFTYSLKRMIVAVTVESKPIVYIIIQNNNATDGRMGIVLGG